MHCLARSFFYKDRDDVHSIVAQLVGVVRQASAAIRQVGDVPKADQTGETSHAEVKGEIVGILVPSDGTSGAGMTDTRQGPDDGYPARTG